MGAPSTGNLPPSQRQSRAGEKHRWRASKTRVVALRRGESAAHIPSHEVINGSDPFGATACFEAHMRRCAAQARRRTARAGAGLHTRIVGDRARRRSLSSTQSTGACTTRVRRSWRSLLCSALLCSALLCSCPAHPTPSRATVLVMTWRIRRLFGGRDGGAGGALPAIRCSGYVVQPRPAVPPRGCQKFFCSGHSDRRRLLPLLRAQTKRLQDAAAAAARRVSVPCAREFLLCFSSLLASLLLRLPTLALLTAILILLLASHSAATSALPLLGLLQSSLNTAVDSAAALFSRPSSRPTAQ